MKLQEAVSLIRTTFKDEQKGDTGGSNSSAYEAAMNNYPVTMATAMALWAHEQTQHL
jgi:hypothetical protein